MRPGDQILYRSTILAHLYFQELGRFTHSGDMREQWVTFAVESGEFWFVIEDREASATAGDIVVCPPGVPFHREVTSSVTFHSFVFSWIHEWTGSVRVPGTVPVGKVTIANIQRLFSDYALLRDVYFTRGVNAHAWRDHLFNDIWLLVCAESSLAGRSDANLDMDPTVREAITLIEAQFVQPISIADVAHSLGLRPYELTRKFRKEMGVTPRKFLIRRRLEQARALILNTDLTLDDISEQCGYDNAFYLSRVFKKEFGESPKRYRDKWSI